MYIVYISFFGRQYDSFGFFFLILDQTITLCNNLKRNYNKFIYLLLTIIQANQVVKMMTRTTTDSDIIFLGN